jgi:hypothetical protein
MTSVREAGVAARSSSAYWACQLLGWGFNALAQTYTAAANFPEPTPRIVIEVLSVNLLALTFSHLLRNYIRRHGWHTLEIAALLPRVLVACILLGLPIAVLMHFMSIAHLWTGAIEDPVALGELGQFVVQVNPLLLRTTNWAALLVAWSIVYFSITSQRDRHLAELRQSELNRALQLAELRLLKSQLNPHFLFNCLNSVRALIADDPAGAQRAVTQLARTLRYTLSAGQEEIVTLDRELEIVEDYLALESLRLGERLRIERTIETAARGARIPVMLLQTVVENAIKHGIAELPQGGVLRISATLQEQELSIEVENPRPTSPARPTSEGIGLRNSAQRLRLLYGERASLDLDLAHADLAVARIRIGQDV